VLDQQENEYEHELKELITAAENEIQNERENTAKVSNVFAFLLSSHDERGY